MAIRVENLDSSSPRCSNILNTGIWVNIQCLIVILTLWHNLYLQYNRHWNNTSSRWRAAITGR